MTLQNLLISLAFVWLGLAIWRHLSIAHHAYTIARRSTQKEGLHLLDQSTVLRGVRLRRSHRSLIALERRFEFEFATIGDVRYRGQIFFLGRHPVKVVLPPFKVTSPSDPDN